MERVQGIREPASVRGLKEKELGKTSQCRLKYWTSLSCFSAASRLLKVPRFRRFFVFGSVLREYRRYSPDFNLRIMGFSEWVCKGYACPDASVDEMIGPEENRTHF